MEQFDAQLNPMETVLSEQSDLSTEDIEADQDEVKDDLVIDEGVSAPVEVVLAPDEGISAPDVDVSDASDEEAFTIDEESTAPLAAINSDGALVDEIENGGNGQVDQSQGNNKSERNLCEFNTCLYNLD